jgi:ribosomal-protein-alanine N-acetyltransferase
MVTEQPTIELAGIRLRRLRPEDSAPWYAYLSDPQVTELTSYPSMSLAGVESMLQRVIDTNAAGTSSKWAVATQADDRLIGTCGFNEWSRHGWAELAYELARPHWGRGIISQAVDASLRWGFTTWPLNRVHAFVMAGYVRSERVLERAGFTREGCLRSYRVSRGVPRDFGVFSILRDEWESGDV